MTRATTPWQSERTIIEQRWVWIRMPEKAYFGRVTTWKTVTGRLCDVDMVDPIPFRWDDEVYGHFTNARTVKEAVRRLTSEILGDRGRYMGDRGWRPASDQARRLWNGRRRRRLDIRRAL